jgi:L,D-peptidoglycan transpeptidase YkuD (ErfK/YbiS/YcfS/YnhG family)
VLAAVVALALAGCSSGHGNRLTSAAPRSTAAASTTVARPITTRRRPAPTSTTTSTSVAPATTVPPSTVPTPAPAQVVAPTAPPPTAAPAQLVDQLADTGGAAKVITVDSPSWASTTATFTGWERHGSSWVAVLGPWTANVGYAGWSWTPGEATGRSPIGSFTFGVGFGAAPNPGYRLGWFPITPTDYWVEDPAAGKAYNTHQQWPANGKPVPWGHFEHLIDYPDAYEYAALIDFNVPVTGSGRGSGIFLHESNGGSTAGCVSLPRDQIVAALRWIDASTRIVMAPDDTIRTL